MTDESYLRAFFNSLIALTENKPNTFTAQLRSLIKNGKGRRLLDQEAVPPPTQRIGDCVTQSNHAFLHFALGDTLFHKLETYSLKCAKNELTDANRNKPEEFNDFIIEELLTNTPVDGTAREGLLPFGSLTRSRTEGLNVACDLSELNWFQSLLNSDRQAAEGDYLYHSIPSELQQGKKIFQQLRRDHGLFSEYAEFESTLSNIKGDKEAQNQAISKRIKQLKVKTGRGRENFVKLAIMTIDEHIAENNSKLIDQRGAINGH